MAWIKRRGETASPPEIETVYVTRLNPEVLAHLEAQLLPLFVSEKSSELQAGFLLGQQSVVKKLRDGFTVSR